MTILDARGNLSEAVKGLWGEVTDPYANFTHTHATTYIPRESALP